MSLLSFLGFSAGSRAGNTGQFDANHGMSLLHADKFNEAAAYFEKHLDSNAIAYYGLALAKFRTDTAHLTVDQAKEIAALYEKSIQLSPDFADAYFMCGMAYNAIAGLQIGAINRGQAPLTSEALQELDLLLKKANSYFDKAVAISPGFSEIAKGERDLNQRIQVASNHLRGRSK